MRHLERAVLTSDEPISVGIVGQCLRELGATPHSFRARSCGGEHTVEIRFPSALPDKLPSLVGAYEAHARTLCVLRRPS